MGLIQEFKEFAVKGNAIDMAVGLVVGGAFTKIVTSLVNDIIMPPLGMAIGGVDFKNLEYVMKPAVVDAMGTVTTPAVAVRYGMFINTVIDFLIVAMCIFFIVKTMNKLISLKEIPFRAFGKKAASPTEEK